MKTNPDFMWDFYTVKYVPNDLRTREKLYFCLNTTRYGLSSQIFCERQLWNSFPTSVEISQILEELQTCVLRTVCVWSLSYSISVYTSLYFLPFPLHNCFFVFLRFLCFLPVLNSTYSHLIYIATIRYFFLFLSITSHLNNL